MNERDLMTVLDDLAEETTVGPPPVAEITARRGQTWVPLAAAAAVVVVAGATALVLGGERATTTPPVHTTTPTATSDPLAVAPGARLLGMGHAAIEIPAGWGTDNERCGTPQSDTVIVDRGPLCLALVARPRDVETIQLTKAVSEPSYPDFADAQDVTIDGVHALALAPTCQQVFAGVKGGEQQTVRVCSSAVLVPAEQALFTSEAANKERALDLLATIRLVPDRLALPPSNAFGARESSGDDQGPSQSGLAYLDAVRATGAEVTVMREFRPAITPSTVLDVSPMPGTMLAPGDPVTVTVVGPQSSPADRVSVGLSWDGGGDETSFTDAEIRAGATLRVPVGTPVWAYYTPAAPVRRGDVIERLSGEALARDHRNGPLWSYVATRPGRSKYTLSVGGDVIGTVTIVVGS